MGFGWEGTKVRLVPLDREKHLENAVAWVNDPEVTQWTLPGDWPMTRAGEEEWFDKVSRGSEREVSFAIETLGGEHIGFTGLIQIDWRHRFATTGTLIGRKDLWGQGYGRDSAQVRTRYALDVLGLEMLRSEVMVGNYGSLRMLERIGYQRVGVVPGMYFKRGERRDVVLLYCNRETWRPA